MATAKGTTMGLIHVNIGKLSDGSHVYSVVFYPDITSSHRIELPCVSEKDAYALKDKMCDAITAHTNESLRVD